MDVWRLSQSKMSQIVNVWKELADDFNGTFKNILCTSPAIIDPINNKIRRFELYTPSVRSKQIVFTTSEKKSFRAIYKFSKNLRLTLQIYPENFIEKIGKLLGIKEIEIGVKDFDRKFILKSSNKDFLIYLLDKAVRDYMTNTLITTIDIRTDGVTELDIELSINEEDKKEMLKLKDFMEYLIQRIYLWVDK